MTKFEQIGVNMQYDAVTLKGANKAFEHSCVCCCQKGMQIKCEQCAISAAHRLVVACFDEQNGNKTGE